MQKKNSETTEKGKAVSMIGLITYHLLFTTQVMTPLELDEHSGSALRGNLFEAVWKRFCNNKMSPSCAECPLHEVCPVSALVAPLREEHPRGRDIPRPYIILPPLDQARRYAPSETMSFGITLFGSIVELLPYLMLSVGSLEVAGLGKKMQGQRGTFRIQQIEAYHPFTAERQVIYKQGKPLVQASTVAVTATDVQARAEQLSAEKLSLTLLTPLRLRDQDQRVYRLTFRPLLQRIMERVMALEEAYGSGEKLWSNEQRREWLERAEEVRCSEDTTHWEEVNSYSRRTHQNSPIGGLMGSITFVGDLAPFRELLIWGEVTHVGKNSVKGNGWYTIANT
jgi:hypothetical protein